MGVTDDRAGGSAAPFVVAVDGGNSKTDVAVVAGDGTLLATVRTSGSNHQRDGVDAAVRTIVSAVRTAQELAGVAGRAAAAVLCLAGLDLPVDDDALGRALAPHRLGDQVLLRNDTFAVLRAGARRGWGVAVVCGAGMNCVGQGPGGEMVRFPALGEISGDWAGGGSWLGMVALGAAVRGSDGRGPRTVLEELVPGHFALAAPYAVTEALYTGRLDDGALTQLAPYVFRAAAAGEAWARTALDRLADEIVAHVRATVRRLDLAGTDVDVVLGGGVLAAQDAQFHDRVRRGILAAAPGADIHPLAAPPVVGAALLALDAVGADAAAQRALRAALTEERVARGGLDAGRPTDATTARPGPPTGTTPNPSAEPAAPRKAGTA